MKVRTTTPITSVKITSKGQVTIPKEIRAKLNATLVYFEVENGVVTIKPVSDAAGSLTEYSKNAKPAASMKQMKDQAREKSVREKAFKKSSRH